MPFSLQVPELLAPAGNLEKLKIAVLYGADAVYLGAKRHSLRARATNFTEEELLAGLAFAHERGVRVYAAVNIFAHNRDMEGVAGELAFLRDAGVDACIVADPGVMRIARRVAPGMPLHLSTQMNVTNQEHALFWQEQGLSRLNLARELSLEEMRAMRSAVSCGLEVFVHGAVCISYSGRCLLSAYFTGRDANQGDCAQPCRYSYALVEEKRPGQYFPMEEDSRGSYVFNARDLCLLPHLPKLVGLKVDALKLEGRMKSVGYVAQVVHLYRHALDWIRIKAEEGADLAHLELPPEFFAELPAIGTRGHTDNFFLRDPAVGGVGGMMHESSQLAQSVTPAGIVREMQEGKPVVESRSSFTVGEELECLLPEQFAPLVVRVTAMEDMRPREADAPEKMPQVPLLQARPNQLLRLATVPELPALKPGVLIRKRRQEVPRKESGQ